MTNTISDRIMAELRARRDAGDTVTKLAELAGVHRTNMSRLLGSKSRLDMQTADRVAMALGLELVARKRRH